jgi:hypothetical protein
MSIEKAVMRFAGTMVFIIALLSLFHSTNWIWGGVFIGANMLQSTFTGFCLPGIIMKKFGMKSSAEIALEL